MPELSTWQKIVHRLWCPLKRVPEARSLVSTRETLRHGFMAPSYRIIAEHLAMGVQYAIHADVEGEIAEFGVQTGRTALLIAASMELFRSNKKLYLFDSFEGLPEATSEVDQKNPHVQSGIWGKGSLKGISPDTLRRKCQRHLPPEQICILKGWFKDTIQQIKPGTRFSLMHIDCDLYLSALEVLDYVFSRRAVSAGAILFFDDWHCDRSNPDSGEQRAWREVVEKYQIRHSLGESYGWGGRKLIVHGY